MGINGCCMPMQAVAITVSFCSMFSSIIYTYVYVRGQQASIFNEIHNEYASENIMEAFDTLEQFLAATGREKYAEEYMRLKMLPREEYLKARDTGRPNMLASLFSSKSAITTDAELGRRLDAARRRLLHYLGKLLMYNNWGYLTDSMMQYFPGRARAMHALELLQPLVEHTARAYNFDDHKQVLAGIQAIYNISFNNEEYRGAQIEFSAKLNQHPRGEPLVFTRGDWRPVCGHWFWDSEEGAATFCQALGYSTGVAHKTRHRLNASAVLIGSCAAGERLGSCNPGGGLSLFNACEINSVGCGVCAYGENAGVEVTCEEAKSAEKAACPSSASGECVEESSRSSSQAAGEASALHAAEAAVAPADEVAL